MNNIDGELEKQNAQQKAIAVVKKISLIAGKAQHVLSYFLVVGGLATLSLVWFSYSSESDLWWSVTKGVLLVCPALVLLFSWTVFGQLSEVPDSMAKLNQDARTAYSGIKEVKVREPKGLRGLFSVLNSFRREESYSVIFDTVGGITLLLNPFFLLLISLSCVLMVLFTFVALLITIF